VRQRAAVRVQRLYTGLTNSSYTFIVVWLERRSVMNTFTVVTLDWLFVGNTYLADAQRRARPLFLGANSSWLTRLKQPFSDGTLTSERLQTQLEDLATLYAQLRQVHLQAHLEVTPLLTQEQVAQYQVLRGYAQN
jgi:hypothetical protein